MKRLLLSLALIGGQAQAGETGMNAPLLAEHCGVELSANTLRKEAGIFNSNLSAALDVTGDDRDAFEQKDAKDYMAEVKDIPYAKMKSDFARLQRTTVLEDQASISSASRELAKLKIELAKADKLLDEHTDLNSGGNYDLAYFTASNEDVMKADVSKVFADERKRGIDCDKSIEDYTITNKKFPGAGEVVKTLIQVSSSEASAPTEILPEVEDFDSAGQKSDLQTAKAQFVRASGEFEKALLLSESRALRVETLIKNKQ